MATPYKVDIDRSQRFEFGRNWERFLRVIDDERIAEAEKSLCAMLEMKSLSGKTFLDVGSGSGPFSLAAMRLGASRVHSFDFDPRSVACAAELKRRYFHLANHWSIEQGSALDPVYLSSLGQFDIVYSWGVLHDTGDMWQALEGVAPLVAPHGKLFIAMYNFNFQVHWTPVWTGMKRTYVRSPKLVTWIMVALLSSLFFSRAWSKTCCS